MNFIFVPEYLLGRELFCCKENVIGPRGGRETTPPASPPHSGERGEGGGQLGDTEIDKQMDSTVSSPDTLPTSVLTFLLTSQSLCSHLPSKALS